MHRLQQFNADSNTREELLQFINSFIESEALMRMYKREDVSHIADARELIEKAFDALNTLYGPKEPTITQTNTAR